MGKRKRSGCVAADNDLNDKTNETPSFTENIPCSSGSGTQLLTREKSSTNLFDSSGLETASPRMDVTDRTAKLVNAHPSLAPHHYNFGRPMYLKRSRHCYGHHYSRRNSGNNANASTSHGKTTSTPFHSEKLSFKLTGQSGSLSGSFTADGEQAFSRSERIRYTSFVMDGGLSGAVKMVCGLCQKLLRRKPYFLEDRLSTGEFSVAAVLVCGHVYHADCLEQRTSLEDRRDPPCPLCSGLTVGL